MNTEIIICNRKFNIGCPVVLWNEPGGMDFHLLGNYIKRFDIDFNELSKKMKQFTIHWSASYRAKETYNGLNARKLSCNFIIDDNNVNGYATIYQCLNLAMGGWSQGEHFNGLGAGVEISYMPTAWTNPKSYSKEIQNKWKVPEHELIITDVHGAKTKVFLPTKAQINSLEALIWGYCEIFPHIKPEFPKDSNGNYITTTLENPQEYTGLVNHYHLRRDKLDVAGLDMQSIEKNVKARLTFGF